ncbi:hypothetical protein L6452_17264 [Arctium lappa]|uniref:Uncharacterized protein n=1 Tax=Arctium lappa TaxID=4217 RepID=A0ACB9C330_ARCLA|nr:hypothetical protein L6452_17264 [Arctium lappa]
MISPTASTVRRRRLLRRSDWEYSKKKSSKKRCNQGFHLQEVTSDLERRRNHLGYSFAKQVFCLGDYLQTEVLTVRKGNSWHAICIHFLVT